MGMAEDEEFVAGLEAMGLTCGGGEDHLAALADSDAAVEQVLECVLLAVPSHIQRVFRIGWYPHTKPVYMKSMLGCSVSDVKGETLGRAPESG